MDQNRIGIEEARGQLGDLADSAHDNGTITTLTRYGRSIAAIVPAGMRATALPDEAIDAAFDAAWPGLPEGVTMGEARRRVTAALNAAYPYLAERTTTEAPTNTASRVTAPPTSTRAFIDCTGHASTDLKTNRAGAKGANGTPSLLLGISGRTPAPDGIPQMPRATTSGAQAAALILPEQEHLLRILGRELRDVGALLMRIADHKHLHPAMSLAELWPAAHPTTVLLISAEPGDRVPGHELADPDCPDVPGLLDRPEVIAFFAEHGYGPDNENALMYLVTDDTDVPDGFPTLSVSTNRDQ